MVVVGDGNMGREAAMVEGDWCSCGSVVWVMGRDMASIMWHSVVYAWHPAGCS